MHRTGLRATGGTMRAVPSPLGSFFAPGLCGGVLLSDLAAARGHKTDRSETTRTASPDTSLSLERRDAKRGLLYAGRPTLPASLGVESVLENGSFGAYPAAALMQRALEDRAIFDAHSEMGQRRWNALARAPERSSDARKPYARRVSEAGRDRRASSGGRATPHEGDHEARDRVGSQLGPARGRPPPGTSQTSWEISRRGR